MYSKPEKISKHWKTDTILLTYKKKNKRIGKTKKRIRLSSESEKVFRGKIEKIRNKRMQQ